MGVVHRRVEALGVALGNVSLIHVRGLDIRLHGVVVAPDAEENMAGHVHEVPGTGHEIGEPVRRRFRLRRIA